jgi:hypothetical protein
MISAERPEQTGLTKLTGFNSEKRVLAAEQRTGVAHGATVGKIPAKPPAPDGAKGESRGFLTPHPGLKNYGTSQPTVAPWATF